MRKLIFSLSGIFIMLLLVGSLVMFFQACSNDDITSPTTSNNNSGFPKSGTGCSSTTPMTTPIYAGQHIPAGNLKVWNNLEKIFIKYEYAEGFYGTQFHLWVGCDVLGIPVDADKNNVNPAPGQFPYKYTSPDPLSSYTFEIPLASLTGCGGNFGCPNSPANIYILAHSDINTPTGGETGWSFVGDATCGKTFDEQWGKSKWGWITCYKFCCTPDNPQPPVTEYYSETAFAKPTIAQGGYVWTFGPKSNPEEYPSLNLNRNRWGWAGKIVKANLPMNFPLWAGCGLNETANGVLVGNVSISNTGTVTYTGTNGCLLSEIHVFLGADAPTTIAPGQYGNTYSFDPAVNTWSHNFTLPEGDFFWFIGHSVAKIPITRY